MVKQQNPSRFSTLKVFNFAGAGGSKADRNIDDSLPPPPPPKDRYYLFNKSMSSLSPDELETVARAWNLMATAAAERERATV